LETDQFILENLKKKKETVITKEQGEDLAKKIGAVGYIEISSLTGENVMKVLELIVTTLCGQKDKCCLM
jgi:hypothetical protein